jgi:hypothetical protein
MFAHVPFFLSLRKYVFYEKYTSSNHMNHVQFNFNMMKFLL